MSLNLFTLIVDTASIFGNVKLSVPKLKQTFLYGYCIVIQIYLALVTFISSCLDVIIVIRPYRTFDLVCAVWFAATCVPTSPFSDRIKVQ